MPVIQIKELSDGFEEIEVDLSKRPLDKVTLLVPCHGDEYMDISPVALVKIDREGARGLLTKLERGTALALEYHNAGDSSLSNIRFMDYRPEFFDGGIFYSGDDELEVLGEAMDSDQILLLTPEQEKKIRGQLPDGSYRWIRLGWSQLVVDPPIDGEPRPYSKGQVYWQSGVKHTNWAMDTETLGLELLKELAAE